MTGPAAYILPFSSSEATLNRAGGKGMNLAALSRAGFPVPPGFLITTDAYRAFVEANHLQATILSLTQELNAEDTSALERISTQIRMLFTDGAMPDAIADEIAIAYARLSAEVKEQENRKLSSAPLSASAPSLPVAVRSSATTEDLPGLSFAGQQDTYLNVIGIDAVLDAVRRCWGSLWTARAIGYRAHNHIPSDDAALALAVVVQTMIVSESSGVLFTANPLTGNRDEMVIDASFGLGEAIVSGQVEPDHYLVSTRDMRIVSRKLGAKAMAILPRAGGGTETVAQHSADKQALPDEQVLELARMAQRAAQHFGAPQDIEWAWANRQLYLLQSRSITSLYPLPQPPSPPTPLPKGEGGLRVYFSFNSVQGVTDPFTPLGMDALRMVFGSILTFAGIKRDVREIMLPAGDRLFIDMTDMARDPRLRRLYLAGLSVADPGARQIILRLMDEGRLPPKHVLTPRGAFRTIKALLPRFANAVEAMRAPESAAKTAVAVADEFVNEVRQHASAANDLPSRLEAMEGDLSQSLGTVLRGFARIMPVLLSMRVIDEWLVGWLGEKPGAVLALMRGLPNNLTTQMDMKLWAVAQVIRADGDAYKTMTTQPVESLVEAYQRGALPDVAQRALAQFLDEYGMRGQTEIDIGRPRWRDDPTPILQALRGYLQLDDPNAAPDIVFQRGAEETERLAAGYVSRVSKLRWGRLRAKMLGALIRRLRLLAGLRESPKFYLVKILDLYRAAMLESGSELVTHGDLICTDDIFFVPLDTLKAFARGEAIDLKSTVSVQRATYHFEQRRRLMPRIMLSNGEAFYEGMSANNVNPDDLVGQAVSPGVAEGVVQVVLDPRGTHLEPGEILVCRATDPSWTPLFLTAGGLVMEIGGMITHGSVVAREYGIPAVVGVNEATTRLKTGQRVRVDGTRGRVTMLE